MLDREDRFYSPSGAIYPGGPSIWHVIDWDQRRLVSVKMDDEQESPDYAFDCLLKHIDQLPPDVYLVHLSQDGDMISMSNDPKDDETLCAFRPPLDGAQLPEDVETISRDQLKEVARLGPNVDLVEYSNNTESVHKFAFKYFFLFQHIGSNWQEMCLWSRLRHPNIVPFNKVVVDELEGRFVGFTSKYIPGDTLEENKSRTFKLEWLHQLTSVVDELNLNLGIAHQDVAPRNILIDESTDTLMLFDFDFSVRIGMTGYSEPRNDVKGVIFTMFEVITGDKARRDKRHEDQDVEEVEQMTWTKHPDIKLDHPVSEFRKVLHDWCDRRRNGTQITKYTQAPNFLDWPHLPHPGLTEVTINRGSNLEPVKEMQECYDWKRTALLKEGKTVLNWQRPPQKWPEKTDGIKGTSTLVNGHH